MVVQFAPFRQKWAIRMGQPTNRWRGSSHQVIAQKGGCGPGAANSHSFATRKLAGHPPALVMTISKKAPFYCPRLDTVEEKRYAENHAILVVRGQG